MSSPAPAVFSSVLAVGLWPLVILVLAVVTVTIVALARADKRDIPAVFGAFAQAFGLHKRTEERDEQRDTNHVAPTDETEQRDEAA
ncbi:hypothetical protein ACIBJI_32760 [Nocardia sp. NPDC050408]|uniref:hypothetical protein n=1 Tax=Nocardia sp. NPDC050408 TaxID=3364319 RepID=UPI0037B30DCA